MVVVTYIRADGMRFRVEVDSGRSVMQGAVDHGLDGIVGECGGNAMCATCHVYVDPTFAALLPVMSECEDALLEGTAEERRAGSRLSCQLPSLDGLVVSLPEAQV